MSWAQDAQERRYSVNTRVLNMAFTGKTQSFLDVVVANNGFFPALNLGDLQRIYRVPAELAKETVEHQVKLAINLTNDSLIKQQSTWQAAGHGDLAAVQEAEGKDLNTYYTTAVYCRAKAELLQDFQTFSRRKTAENMAKDGEESYRALLVDSNRAVRRLKGINTNITARLL